jgi:hypothetical protein
MCTRQVPLPSFSITKVRLLLWSLPVISLSNQFVFPLHTGFCALKSPQRNATDGSCERISPKNIFSDLSFQIFSYLFTDYLITSVTMHSMEEWTDTGNFLAGTSLFIQVATPSPLGPSLSLRWHLNSFYENYLPILSHVSCMQMMSSFVGRHSR